MKVLELSEVNGIKGLATIVVFLMLLVATTAQAKRVVERPYFLGSNNHKLEIERVTLDKKATFLDVKIYQKCPNADMLQPHCALNQCPRQRQNLTFVK